MPANLWLLNFMDPLIIASMAISILREAMSAIEAGVKAGNISVEAQEAQLRKIDMLRLGQFTGPEWILSDTPSLPGVPVSDATKPDV